MVVQRREGGLLLSIRMAGRESKVARPYETLAKKSRKGKPPKANSSLFEVRAPEPSEELELEPEVWMKYRIHQYHLKVTQRQISQRVNPHRRQTKLCPLLHPKMLMSSCQGFWKR